MYVYLFQDVNWVNINRFSPNLVCTLILWKSSFGLLMGKFCHFWILYIHPSVFSHLDDKLSKFQWIFTKLGMCIDIVEIWFGIANMQICSTCDRVICLPHDSGWVISRFYFLNSLLTQHILFTYIHYSKSYIHRGERDCENMSLGPKIRIADQPAKHHSLIRAFPDHLVTCT